MAVRLEVVEREVLGWLDPTADPQIEWSRYILGRHVEAALRPLPVWDRWPAVFRSAWQEPGRAVPHVLIAVMASAGAMDRPERLGSAEYVTPVYQPVDPRRKRDVVVALFDAQTGARIVAVPAGIAVVRSRDGEQASNAVRAITSAPAVRVAFDAAGLRTPTPRPTQTPFETLIPPPMGTAAPALPRVPLTAENVPAALRATFDAYPLGIGSSWTWMVRASNGGVRWTVCTVTETVSAAWLYGEAAEIESTMVVDVLTPRRPIDADADPYPACQPGTRTRHITTSLGIAGDRNDVEESHSLVGLRREDELAGGSAFEVFAWPYAAWGMHRIGFLEFGPEDGRTPIDVVTPAGPIHGCWQPFYALDSRWSAERVFCPGVGYPSSLFGGATSNHDLLMRADLLRWSPNRVTP